MSAARYDLKVDAGSDFSLPLGWENADETPVDLTGCTARMQIRRAHTSPDPATLSLSSPSSGIVIDPLVGELTVSITKTQTAALAPGNLEAVYVYDVEIETAGGIVTRLIEGTLRVKPEVTR